MKTRFSESFTNKILRLILEHRITGDYPVNTLPPDTVICPFQVNLHLSSAKNKFIKFKNGLEGRFKEKPYIILLKIIHGVSSEKGRKTPVEPRSLYRLLESLVFFIENGVQVIEFDKTVTPDINPSAAISQENLMYDLIANVIREINTSTCIITDKNKIENNQHLLAEVNKLML